MKTSIIIPAYNEEHRISNFLKDIINIAKKIKNSEIIIVDDGSKDNTIKIVKNLTKKDKNVRIIFYKPNKGKGGAVREGILSATGDYVLFIDADGATPASEIPKMIKKLKDYDIIVGNRQDKKSVTNRNAFRKYITGYGFNLGVSAIFQTKLTDNLCGFKGFKREIAIDLFKDLISYGWIFDVEILFKAHRKNYSICNLPITWMEKSGSNFKMFDPEKLWFQLLMLRLKILFESKL